MLILAAALAIAPATRPDRLDFQMMASPVYDVFAAKGEALCPARKLRYLHPADLAFLEEGFLPSLTPRARHRVTLRDVGDKGCTGGGLSCPAQHMLAAISEAGLLDAFVSFACVAPA
ncbi:MAG: hypothetical protein ACRCS5_01035 [Sphingomonas sp.]|jgi:hypothetical protein|nr:hypothetical protein [Sphingomonas sp. TF3]RUN78104.1 hypothetical protein EJC47_01895 [Sphingomonas sp. TF3]